MLGDSQLTAGESSAETRLAAKTNPEPSLTQETAFQFVASVPPSTDMGNSQHDDRQTSPSSFEL
jgi:hypothetical protein